MNIQNEKKGEEFVFFIKENNEKIAEIVYEIKGNIILIKHTEVDESMSGKGIGHKLIAAVVDQARDTSKMLKSVCPFAKKVLESTPEYSDVFAQ